MSIMNMNLGGFDADEARYNRLNRTSQPEFQPGMEPSNNMDLFSDNNSSNDIFSQSAQPANNTMAGDIFSSSPQPMQGGFGQQPMQGGFGQPMQGGMNNGGSLGVFNSSPNGFGMPSQNGMMQAPQQQLSQEEQFFNAMVKGAKTSGNFLTDFINSFGKVTPRFWVDYGRSTMIAGVIVSGASLLLMLLGWLGGLNLLLAGLFSIIVGTFSLFFNMDKVKNFNINSPYKDEAPQQPIQPQVQQPAPAPMPMQDDFSSSDDDFFNNSPSDDDDDWGGDDDDDDWLDSDEDDFDIDIDAIDNEPEPAMSADEALNSIPEVENGMFTRQYLYDAFMKVLPQITPNFSTFEEIDEDDDIFLYWDEKIQEAASVTGLKEEALEELELTRLRANSFTVELTTTRPTGFKSDVIANELASIYAYNDGEKRDGVFAKSYNVGAQSIITIFTGESPMISVKDMINKEKDWFLDSANTIPVVWGVDPEGKVIKTDLRKLESLLITGMPRSGKSWLTTAVLAQMCAFMSPKDLHFYICDPKAGISDYSDFCLPHVKKFVSGDDNIVAAVRELVTTEGDRRKELLGNAGYKNIWDYRDRYPDVELPLIYVVIDEVVSLAERMEKDTKAEFQAYLTMLITQMPALGIRAIFIPHVIKDQVIKKTTTDTILCRISVRGDAQHVETVTGAKPKDFPFKLMKQGDMAVRMPEISDKVMFVKAPVLNKTNEENKQLFDYMRRYWIKILPGCDSNTVAITAEVDHANQEVLNNLGLDDFNLDEMDDDLDFGDLFGN